MGWYGLDQSGSGYGPVEGSCEHDNELQTGCTSVFTISLYSYLYNVFYNMFRSYMTIIRLFYMYINHRLSTIPPCTSSDKRDISDK
jgi:hypothetical protein